MENESNVVSNSEILNAEVEVNTIQAEVEADGKVLEEIIEENLSDNETDSNKIRTSIMNDLAGYEAAELNTNKLKIQRDELMMKLRETNPTIFEEIDKVDADLSLVSITQDNIKKTLKSKFSELLNITQDDELNKTLVYNKVQATYVYPTKKHSFDLKKFISEENEFYIDNISIMSPYATISDVSDSVKITIKK